MKPTEQILKQIERQVHFSHQVLQKAIAILLDDDTYQAKQDNFLYTADDLERHIHHWQFLIPQDMTRRCQLIKQITEHYVISTQKHPRLVTELGLHNDEIKTTFEMQFGMPLTLTSSVDNTINTDANDLYHKLFQQLTWRHYERGTYLYHQGEIGDYLYGIVNGHVLLSTDHVKAKQQTVNVYDGILLGKEGLSVDSQYHATAQVVRDSEIFYLHRDQVEQISKTHPHQIIQVLYRLLKQPPRYSLSTPPKPTVKSVVVLPITDGIASFTNRLAQVFEKYQQKSTVTLSLADLARQTSSANHTDEAFLANHIRTMERKIDIIFIEAALDYLTWTQHCLEQADHILIVGRHGEVFDYTPWKHMMANISHPDLFADQELIILRDKLDTQTPSNLDWIQNTEARRHHHVTLDTDNGFERISRFLSGNAIGLVFGGGGMRGACHHGVIQAVNEAGIQADIVGGTSAGAIVAAQYAAGWTVDEMFQRTREDLLRPEVLRNFTFPLVAFTSGERVTRVFQSWFGDLLSEELLTTCFTISANLTLTTQSTNQYGPLWRNVRYSTSIAGLFPPVPDEAGYLHIDGGVYNNTPSDVMREFVGAGTVIASDLGYTRRQPVRYDYGPYVSGWRLLSQRLNPLTESTRFVNISDVLMQSNALAARAATKDQVASSDLLINPNVPDIGLFDFEAADSLYQAGYDAAAKVLDNFPQNPS